MEEKKKIAKEFNIASGLFQSHAVFMAPGTTNAILRQHQAGLVTVSIIFC